MIIERGIGTFVQLGSGAVSRTFRDKARETFSLEDFGVKTDGTDCTARVQAAFDAAGSYPDSVCIRMPHRGFVRVTSKITISGTAVSLIGDGPNMSGFLFDPSANGTCLEIAYPGAFTIGDGACISGLSFRSNDSTHTKVAINLIDVSNFLVSEIVIGGSVAHAGTQYWSGGAGTGDSVGLQINGREALRVRGYYIVADRPVVMGLNPHTITYELPNDHYHFQDGVTIAYQSPHYHVVDDAPVQSLTIDGYQAMVHGTYGVLWVNRGSGQYNREIKVENARWEQNDPGGVPGSGWFMYFDMGAGVEIHNLFLNNLDNGDSNNFYLRGVDRLSCVGGRYAAAGVILNADSTVSGVKAENVDWVSAGGTFVLTGFTDGFVQNGKVVMPWLDSVNATFLEVGNKRYLGMKNLAGTVRKVLGMGTTSAGGNAVAISAESDPTIIGGTLSVGMSSPTSHMVAIGNGQSYAVSNSIATGTIAAITVNSSNYVVVSPDTATILMNAIRIILASGSQLIVGTGSPEGVVVGYTGSVFLNANGGAGVTFYVKESGFGNVGWVAK